MNKNQEKQLYSILRLFLLESHELRAKVEAFEKVLLKNTDLRDKFETERLAATHNRLPSTSLEEVLEALRVSLFPENPA